MAATDALGGQFNDYTPKHADNWYPNETDEDGTFLDRREAVRSVMKAKPASARSLFSSAYRGTGSRSDN